MKKMGGVTKLFFALIIITDLAGTAAPSLSNSGGGSWQYYREITIKENSGNTLVDYQVFLQLSGGSFPTIRSDGGDIRFTDANENELSYWIEKWDYAGRSASIWVKVPNIPANDNMNIKMYYGNPSANSVSSGDKTFEFFDEFEGISPNVNKWDSNGAVSVSGGKLTLDAAGEFTRSKLNFNRNVALRMDAYFKLADATDWIGFIDYDSPPFAIFELQSNSNPSKCGGANTFNARNYIQTDECYPISDATDAFRIFELTWLSDENRYYVDNALKVTHTKNVPSPEPSIALGQEQLIQMPTIPAPVPTTPKTEFRETPTQTSAPSAVLTPLITPALSVSQDPFFFDFGIMSAGETSSQTFTISSSYGGTLTWAVTDDQPWITLSPTGGTNSGTVTINVDTAGLNPGSYSGTISVTSNSGTKEGSISLKIPAALNPTPTSTPASISPLVAPPVVLVQLIGVILVLAGLLFTALTTVKKDISLEVGVSERTMKYVGGAGILLIIIGAYVLLKSLDFL